MNLIAKAEHLLNKAKYFHFIVGVVLVCAGSLSFASLSMAYDIVILKSSNSTPYNMFEIEFSKALPGINIRVENMDGDIEKGKELMMGFTKENTDMVVALGPRAAWVSKTNRKVPVLISMLSNPERYNLKDHPGVSLDYSMEQRLKGFVNVIPDLKRIGIIYSKENEKFVAEAKKVAEGVGLEIVGKRIKDITSIKTALNEVLPRIDALWMRTDKIVTSNSTVIKKLILLHALQRKIPIIGSNKWAVNNGALFCLFTDYEDIGLQTSEMVQRMMNGEKFGMLNPVNVKVFVNAYVYERLSPSVNINVSDATIFSN